MEDFTNFHQSRAGQLADFLRSQIAQGKLANPLPSTRVWCRRLGVGRPSLLRALKVLEHEGLLSVTSQGVAIKPSVTGDAALPSGRRVARLLFLGRNYPDLHQCVPWLFLLIEEMQYHGITLSIERCSAHKLRAFARQGAQREEICFLTSLPESFQKLFSENKSAAIVFGYPAQDVTLPFVTPDIGSSVRHATQSLLRRGLKHVILISSANREAGVVASIEKFRAACSEWKDQPIRCDVELVWNHLESMRDTINRISARIHAPCGIVVFPPFPLGLLVTTFLKAGLSIPEQVQIIGIEYYAEDARVGVPITFYEFPTRRFVKAIMDATIQYFESGKISRLRKFILMEATGG